MYHKFTELNTVNPFLLTQILLEKHARLVKESEEHIFLKSYSTLVSMYCFFYAFIRLKILSSEMDPVKIRLIR